MAPRVQSSAPKALINTLPIEILIDIFRLCHNQSAKVVFADTPWTLVRVCRRWRDIVASTPKLWDRIIIDDSQFPQRLLESTQPHVFHAYVNGLLDAIMRLAQNKALTVTFRIGYDIEWSCVLAMLQALVRQARPEDWKSLEFEFRHPCRSSVPFFPWPCKPGSLCNLERLVLPYPMDDENIFRFLFVIGPTPKLRELHLGGYPRQISISRDTLRNLTHFSINHDELVESDSSPFPLISQMHALQSLSLSWADIPWIHPKATTLNHLHTIHVTTWPAEFNHFTFPSLRHVHIDNINITTIKIPSFVHVLPQLTSLTLDYVPPMDVTLLRMAMMLTSLERLTIFNGCIGSLFFEGLARPIVMPHLRELYMHGPSFVPVHTFVSMQLSRPRVKAILETRSAVADCVEVWNDSVDALYSIVYPRYLYLDGSVMHGFGEPQQDYLFDESHGQNLLQYETLRKAIRDLHPRIRAPPRQYERLEQTVPEYGRLKDRALKL